MQVTYRTLWQTACPLLLSLLTEQLIGITDTAFLGRLGQVELAASAVAGVCYLMLYVAGSGFGVGLQILIARLHGEDDPKETANVLGTGICFLLLLAVVLVVGSRLCLPPLLSHFLRSEAVCRQAVAYLDWRIYSLPFSFLIVAFRAYFVGVSRTKVLALSSSVMVLVNVACNYVLIFGRCGLPALGISGAALGSTIAEAVAMLLLAAWLMGGRANVAANVAVRLGLRLRHLRRILNLSAWTMLQSMLSFASWFLFFVTIEHLGEQALAVSNVVRSISTVPFIFIMAFASTGSVFVSRVLGADRGSPVRGVCTKTAVLCYATCLPVVCLGALLPVPLLHVYTDSAALVRAALPPLYVLFTSYLVAVPAFVLYYTVSGTGNTLPALAIGVLSLLLYSLYILLVGHCKPSLLWLWASEHVYAACLFLFSTVYLTRFHWRRKRV